MSLGGHPYVPMIMVDDVNQTRSCTTWNGSSEGFQEEMQVYKTPRNGEKSGFQLMGTYFNGHEV